MLATVTIVDFILEQYVPENGWVQILKAETSSWNPHGPEAFWGPYSQPPSDPFLAQYHWCFHDQKSAWAIRQCPLPVCFLLLFFPSANNNKDLVPYVPKAALSSLEQVPTIQIHHHSSPSVVYPVHPFMMRNQRYRQLMWVDLSHLVIKQQVHLGPSPELLLRC